MTTTSSETSTFNRAARILPALKYGIALVLGLSGPALVLMSLALAVISGDARIIGPGLLAGALLGAAGGLGLIWCLSGGRRS